MRNLIQALAIVALCIACAVVPGQAATGQKGTPTGTTALGYQEDLQVSAFRTGLTGADTKTEAGVLATTTFESLGKKNISITPTFSASGATVSIRVGYVGHASGSGGADDLVGQSDPVTFTASDVVDASGRYLGNTVSFSTQGFYEERITVSTAPSSGNVAIWAGSY